ncbi:hypothetical protein ZEAMMB73_Zm00001d017178 [Zea mays]|uniref:Uncharacterized protein n=1 Tax=Zea mays TaxID=4577 RepID=A0A1D6HCV5_MAIZE|nr:hypothetical protein ZEAMMB73_Zm00001d017178 [Zea mays]
MACSTNLCFSASIPPLPASSSSSVSSPFLTVERVSYVPSLSRWTIRYKQLGHAYQRSHVLAFASADASQGKRSSGENVVMVDPLEAKRLAAKQMQEIRAKEKLKLAGYLTAISSLFGQ